MRSAYKHLVVVMAFLAMAAEGATYTWNGDVNSSWLEASSYKLNGETPQDPPSPGDTVTLPANAVATVNDDSVAFVGALSRLSPASGARLYVNITTNAVMGCAIAGSSTSAPYGALVKSGAGTLTLASANAVSSSKAFLDCFTSLEINGGDIVLPQGNAALTSKYYEMGTCTVAEGCCLHLPDTCNTYINTLNGGGIVTNSSSSARNLRLKGSAVGTFAGKIGGPTLSLEVYNNTVNLTGTESTFGKDFAVNGGVVGAMDFGTTTASASSIGLDSALEVRGGGGTLRYLDTTSATLDKSISIYAADAGCEMPFTLDGGACGGLTITGEWKFFTNTKNFPRLRRIVLAGSNATECVVANQISNASDGGTNYTFSLTKTGSGVWRLANNAARNFRGSVAVDEGTLRFDSIDETNVVCALGMATDPYGDLEGLKDETKRLPYVIRLGAAEAEGKFDYTGTGFAQTKTRKIGLAGNARLIHNGTAGFVRLLSGVSAITPGAKTLTLDGDGTVDCEVANVSDGDGVVSVVKEGDGIWALTGEQSFSGSLHVKRGTLYLRNPDHYNWFRWVLKENLGGSETRIYEFGLFDSSSNRVNKGIACLEDYATDAGNLQYGTAAFGRYTKQHSSSQLSYLFDGSTSTHTRYNASAQPTPGNESSWIYIVMHVAADANVASFDYAPYSNAGNYETTGPKAFALQGSLDGGTWTNLYETTSEAATAHAKWHYIVENVTASGKHGGQEIDTTIPQERRASCFLDNVSTIEVDEDATIVLQGDVTLSRLTVNLAGAGTISGGALAANGSLEITGALSGSSADFPLTFENVSGVENLCGWKLAGDLAGSVRIALVNGVLKVKSIKGFSLTIR